MGVHLRIIRRSMIIPSMVTAQGAVLRYSQMLPIPSWQITTCMKIRVASSTGVVLALSSQITRWMATDGDQGKTACTALDVCLALVRPARDSAQASHGDCTAVESDPSPAWCPVHPLLRSGRNSGCSRGQSL